jgi:hypothetical protein
MPEPLASTACIYGHIRLDTSWEAQSAMAGLGFTLKRCIVDSNNSGYRGAARSCRRRSYRCYERLEQALPTLRGMDGTWYLALRKSAS